MMVILTYIFLGDWHTDHVALGLPNIRFSPLTRDTSFRGPVLHPGIQKPSLFSDMAEGTFGYVMKISLEDEDKLNADYAKQGRIRLVHSVQFAHLPGMQSTTPLSMSR